MFIAITGITFALLLSCTLFGFPIWYGLIVSFIMFAALAKKRGHSFKNIGEMSASGIKKALIVVSVFAFIGTLSASWMLCGTVPYLVYYGIQIIHPAIFYAVAFLLCAVISYVIGTSFGTVAVMGVVLMAIARSGGMNVYITAGAIVSGIYFGDRASPMSSALMLIGTLCETEHYENVKMAFKTAIIPAVLAFMAFMALSLIDRPESVATHITDDIAATFSIPHIVLLPVAVILVLCVKKVNVRIAMLASSVVAWFVAFFVQSEDVITILKTVIFGFSLPEGSPLHSLIKGGGIMSMLNVAIIVTLSCSIAGIIQNVGFIKIAVGNENKDSRAMLFIKTIITAAISAAVGCNQSIAIVMSSALRKELYWRANLSNMELAKDVSVAAAIVPVFIPWNVAVLVPVTTLGISGIGYMPFLLFAYAIVLWRLGVCYMEGRVEKKYPKSLKNH